MNSKITSEKGSSRRDFLVNAGIVTVGAIAAGGVVGAFSPRKAEAVPAPALNWPYPTNGLDAVAVARAGYWGYKSKMPDGTTSRPTSGAGIGGCMYGTVVALIEALAAATPTGTWDTFNPAILTYGKGGVYNWGTLCGSANGATAIIQMVTQSDALVNEFMGWYCDNPFPSSMHDGYGSFPGQGTTVCNSPLCHQSSGKWAHTYGFLMDAADGQRSTRCAKVAGDCAWKVAIMLNAWKAGTLAYAKSGPDYQAGVDSERCFTCHQVMPNDNVQGRMDCLSCHPDKVCHNGEI